MNFRFIGLLMLYIFLFGNIIAQDEKINSVEINLKVTDENGNAIPGAKVVVGEGQIHATTDPNGLYSFISAASDLVTISARNYKSQVIEASTLIKDANVKLVKVKLFMGEDDIVELPFNSLKKRNLTGSITVIKGDLLQSYPSSDIRNAFTGLATGVEVVERSGAPGVQAEEVYGSFNVVDKATISSRGRPMKYMVDGIPVDITQMPVDPEEIESVTVIKDIVGKAMFGPVVAEGIIYITTKRGVKNERSLKIDIENGVNTIDRMPEWVSGSEYAQLNNLARTNQGLTANYSDAQIAAYANNDPYNKFTPSIDFRKMIIKDTRAFRRVNISSNGGNNAIQYHSYLGYNGEGDNYKIGSTSDYNRINTRSNIDIKINEMLKVKFDFYGGLTYRRSPNYGFTTDYSNDFNTFQNIHEFNSVINDITSIPPIAFPVYAGYDEVSNNPWYGVSANYGTNPIGSMLGNGYYTEQTRIGTSNVELEYDMSHFIKGLKSRSYLGVNILNLTRLGKAEDYTAYIATPSKTALGVDTILLARDNNHVGFNMTDQVKLHDFYSHNYNMFQSFVYERSFGNHDIQSTLTYFISKGILNDTEEPRRQQNGVWSANYSFRNKYILQGVMNYAGTYSFAKDKRYALFPSGGAAWVISEEGFMSNVKAINFLKIRAEYGMIGFESFLPPFYYRDRWNVNNTGTAFGPGSTSYSRWFGTNTDNAVYRTTPGRIGNPDLTWEKRTEFSLGLDALLLNEKLSFEVTYYNNLRDGMVSQLANTLPYLVGISGARPWYNYNSVRFTGVETGVQYTDKVGAFTYSIGGNALFQSSEVLKYDVPNYRYGYQSLIGKSLGTIFGQTYIGKFESDAETQIVPQAFDNVLQAGDLKYKDMNNDGVIDDNDQSEIGNGTPKLVYSLNIRLNYRNFDFLVIGTGRAFYDIAMTNKYFWNGWGDNTYSKFVRDNINGDYPRLTYNKINNNFITSSYWLRDGGFFKIQNVELGYTIRAKAIEKIRSRGIRVYVRGANLLTISKIKDVDPEYISSGIYDYPLNRTFTGGVKFTF